MAFGRPLWSVAGRSRPSAGLRLPEASRAAIFASGMLRSLVKRTLVTTNKAFYATVKPPKTIAESPASSGHGHGHVFKSHEELDQEILGQLTTKDMDSWDLRMVLHTIHHRDAVPEPKIITAALKAIRKQNDFALAVRFLEAVKFKCGPQVGVIWPYLLKEIQPTLDELGVLTPEQMGYDKPELALKSVYDM